MPALNILTNLEADRPPIPRAQLVDAEITTLGRLPGGMVSGKSSIAVYAKLREPLLLPDGRTIAYVFCETSLDLLNMANSAFAGAEQRDDEERQRIIRGN